MKKVYFISFMICCMFSNIVYSQTINTIVGNGIPAYFGDGGAAIYAQVEAPSRICMDTFGNIYFLDLFISAVRKIDIGGDIHTIAGSASSGYFGDSGPAISALFNYPLGIATDMAGNVYIADQLNQRIRKIDVGSGVITTIAGTGIPGFSGDDSLATNAKLEMPASVALDDSGNVYIADQYNNRVRKINTSSNIITTIAGTGIAGDLGDGALAVNAQLDSPFSVAVDHSYNVYITDYNHAKVRKIDATTKHISTFAGTGVYGYSGDNGLASDAKLELPADLQIDGIGNLYIVDENASVIRKVNLSTDTISTIAGTGVSGYNGDGISATSAKLNYPIGACINHFGNTVFIADKANSRIRKISPGSASVTNLQYTYFIISPNPTNGVFVVMPENSISQYSITIRNTLGQTVYKNAKCKNQTEVDISEEPIGVYFIFIQSGNESKMFKVIVNR